MNAGKSPNAPVVYLTSVINKKKKKKKTKKQKKKRKKKKEEKAITRKTISTDTLA